MKIDKRIPRLRFFRELYEEARSSAAPLSERFAEHEAQYRGDDRIDGSSERAGAVRNITYEIVETQVSSELPMPKVTARHYSEDRERLAKSIERLCTSVRALPFGKRSRYSWPNFMILSAKSLPSFAQSGISVA